jgi:hypothetical protein
MRGQRQLHMPLISPQRFSDDLASRPKPKGRERRWSWLLEKASSQRLRENMTEE